MQRRTVLSLAATAFASRIAMAQPAPTGPVKIIVGFSPGGGTDAVARLFAQKLGTLWNTSVIVENRDGASGVLASRAVAKMPGDGSTLMMANFSSHSGAPALNPSIGYDFLKDFTPLALIGITPCILLARAGRDAATMDSVIAACRKEPGRIAFGSAGVGSVQHLALEMFKLQAKVEAMHVPYKGSGPMLVDLLGGQINYSWENAASAAPYVKQGRLVALAQASSARMKLFPNVPTTAEAGLPDFQAATWYGMLAPPKMPAALAQRINADLNKVLAMQDVADALEGLSAVNGGGPPSRFAEFMTTEHARWAKVVKEAKVTV